MRTLKNSFMAFVMLTVLAFGTTFANAGIIVAGFDGGSRTTSQKTYEEPCTEPSDEKIDWGIIVAGLRGIIVAGFGGIIVAGAAEAPTECGIIVAG